MEYKIYSPGGNDTALVLGDDCQDYKAVADELMARHPNVEQVGFLSLSKHKLTMAGGEFCGNASRAACRYYLGGRPGSIELETAGQLIKCGIDEDGSTWLELPAPSAKQIDDGIYLVKLGGITHIVVTEDGPPAVGMIVAEKLGKAGGRINPFVYVRGADTFVNETACLSGTVAAAAIDGVDCAVGQPSGNVVSVEFKKGVVKVSGYVKELS